MITPIDALILDLLESLAPRPRTYSDVMSAWRTSCPQLPVWEEATDRGFIERRSDERGAVVGLTAVGRQFLEHHRRSIARGGTGSATGGDRPPGGWTRKGDRP